MGTTVIPPLRRTLTQKQSSKLPTEINLKSSKNLSPAFHSEGLFDKPKTILDDPIAINISKIDDPYQILNISENASEKDILRAYKKLALKYHPDRHQKPVESGEFAMLIMQKLNEARASALSQLTLDKQKTDGEDVPLGDYQTFTGYLSGIIFSDVFQMKKENIHLLCSDENYCLAMVLNWVDHVLNQDQLSFFKELKPTFAKKSTVEHVLHFAKQNRRYISEQMENNIRDRTLADLLTQARATEDSSIKSTINVTWNFEIKEFSKQMVDLIIRLPNTPFLIHNVQDKEEKYIGILYQEERFYLFSPYHLLIDREKNRLQSLNQDEFTHYLLAHFYSFPKMIAQEATHVVIPIAICSFENVPKPLLDVTTSFSLASPQLHFFDYILHRHMPASINEARRFLQSIRDCYIKGLLTAVYAQAPVFFSLELLYEFLDEAIATDHLLLAFEICNVAPQNIALTQQLGTYYINHYLTGAKDYRHLPSIIESFRNCQIELGDWINKDNQAQEGILPKDIKMLMDDKAILQCFLGFGFRLSWQQRQQLVHQFSADIDKQTNELRYALISSLKGEVSPKLRDKIEFAIQNAIDRMEILIAYGYSLHVDHYLTSNHPFFALLKAQKNTLVQRYCEEGHINLDAKDKDGKTILNHMSQLKNWDMVAFLCGMNAPYASGPDIHYEEIPLLVGWLRGIVALQPWYLPTQPALILSLMTKQGDPLCVALHTEKIEQAEFLLANGYLDKFKQTPLLYLYHAAGFQTIKLLLGQISLTERLSLGDQTINLPNAYRTDDFLHELIMKQPFSPRDEWPTLIGLSRDETDHVVSGLPFSSLTKISAEDSNTVFYSSSAELTETLSLFFHPKRLEKHIKSIESLLTMSHPNQVPNVSYFMNTLINMASCVDRSLSLLQDHKLYSRFLDKHLFDKTSYLNCFECLEGNPMPMGLQVTYDKAQRICDFRFIADTTVVIYGNVISFDGIELEKSNIREEYYALGGDLFWKIIHLAQLKIVFEALFDISFSTVSDYESPTYGDYMSFVEPIREEWSVHKKEWLENTETHTCHLM